MTQSAISSPLPDLARKHLPAEAAERWIGLLRPAARLVAVPEPGPEDVVVGKLGGLPALPEDMEWPVWEGHGPLSFVASVDCGALPTGALDIPLPADGTLAFFYFDGQIDDCEAVVHASDPESWAGTRVVHIPAGVAVTERALPVIDHQDEVDDEADDDDEDEDDEYVEFEAYTEVPLTVRVELTAPDVWHPDTMVALSPGGVVKDPQAKPEGTEAFLDALYDLQSGTDHHIGGHAHPVQNPVEYEIAYGLLGNGIQWDDPRVTEEAKGWTLLAQIDTDGHADMMWGDCGALYWLMRPEDLAERRFDRAMFTMQCC
ncbi:YwqG family protein [Streptomyces cinnamoneus]|uniref:YwqG family protein n=1 Tax=Streptomyces cinnamoneus TaxID=53446 RepID=UPI003421EF44